MRSKKKLQKASKKVKERKRRKNKGKAIII